MSHFEILLLLFLLGLYYVHKLVLLHTVSHIQRFKLLMDTDHLIFVDLEFLVLT